MILRYRVKWTEWRWQREVKRLFYSDKRFKSIDESILSLKNPYRIARTFPYGETPIMVWKMIADRLGLGTKDTVIDLGCGRGRGLFFLNHYTGCKVHGIDHTPQFISHAKRTAKEYRVPATFTCEDMRRAPFEHATVVYLYGTCLDEAMMEALEDAFRRLPQGARIVTVSERLKHFYCESQAKAGFAWGTTDLFFHRL